MALRMVMRRLRTVLKTRLNMMKKRKKKIRKMGESVLDLFQDN
jgi:hypothetical protein